MEPALPAIDRIKRPTVAVLPNLDVPAVMRSGRRTTVEAMSTSGVGTYDIPAFLRRQAD